MNHDEDTECGAEADQQQSLVIGRGMVGIREDDREIVQERRLRLLETDTALAHVGPSLRCVPLEVQVGHRLNVHTKYVRVHEHVRQYNADLSCGRSAQYARCS